MCAHVGARECACSAAADATAAAAVATVAIRHHSEWWNYKIQQQAERLKAIMVAEPIRLTRTYLRNNDLL